MTSTSNLELAKKFQTLEEAANDRMVERHEEIRTGIIALLAGVHHYQGGPPGVGKSFLVTTLSDLIDGAQTYQNLMTRQTKMEEVFGPISFKGLEDDRVRFNTDGFLPGSHFAFLDEIFKSSSSTLNALLWVLNERKFRNDGMVTKIPLVSMFCASNELPQGEELSALWDRIHFRHWLRPIQEGGSFVKMLKAQGDPKPDPVVTIEDLLLANEAVNKIAVHDDVYDALFSLRQGLGKEGIEITDRRFAEGLKVIRACAFFRGADTAQVFDIRLLHHMLWEDPEGDNRAVVEKIVTAIASPLDEEAVKLRNEVEKLAKELEDAITGDLNSAVRIRTGVAIQAKIKQATDDLMNLKGRMAKAGYESEMIGQIKTRLRRSAERALSELFNYGEDADDTEEK